MDSTRAERVNRAGDRLAPDVARVVAEELARAQAQLTSPPPQKYRGVSMGCSAAALPHRPGRSTP